MCITFFVFEKLSSGQESFLVENWEELLPFVCAFCKIMSKMFILTCLTVLCWLMYALTQQEKFNWQQSLLWGGKRFDALATLPVKKETLMLLSKCKCHHRFVGLLI